MVSALLIGEQAVFPLGVFPASSSTAEMNEGSEFVFLLDRGWLIADRLHHLAIEPSCR